MISLTVVLIVSILIAVSGAVLWKAKREKDCYENTERLREENEYLEQQRIRMSAHRAEFMKEIEQITKARHPESTRHQRRAVASRYKQQIKSS